LLRCSRKIRLVVYGGSDFRSRQVEAVPFKMCQLAARKRLETYTFMQGRRECDSHEIFNPLGQDGRHGVQQMLNDGR
jgi:hypothetical protein